MEASTIVVKNEKGHMVVKAMGRTPRGTNYVKASVVLKATKPTDKNFKKEVTAAVDELLGSGDPVT